jgi:hypothetical protein
MKKLHIFELHHFHWALVHASTFSQTMKFLNIGDLVAPIQFEEQHTDAMITYWCSHSYFNHFLQQSSCSYSTISFNKVLVLIQPFPSTKFLFIFNHFFQQSSCSYSTISFNKVLVLIQPFPSAKFSFLFNHSLQHSSK